MAIQAKALAMGIGLLTASVAAALIYVIFDWALISIGNRKTKGAG